MKSTKCLLANRSIGSKLGKDGWAEYSERVEKEVGWSFNDYLRRLAKKAKELPFPDNLVLLEILPKEVLENNKGEKGLKAQRKAIRSNFSTWNVTNSPRGKNHNKTENKTTVSLYLSKNLVEKARNHNLNLSIVTEQALSSILDYIGTQNIQKSSEYSIQGSVQEKLYGGPDRIRTGDLLHVKQMS
jgi:hypothetical protein